MGRHRGANRQHSILGMHFRTHRFRLLTFAFAVLLMAVLAAALFTPRDQGEGRHRLLMKTSELTAGIARRLGIHSLEQSIWNWRHELFKSDLDHCVRRGQLSRVSVHVDWALPSFTADLSAFAGSNSVQLVFTQTMLTNQLMGGTCTVYVQAGDATIMRDYMDLQSKVLTKP